MEFFKIIYIKFFNYIYNFIYIFIQTIKEINYNDMETTTPPEFDL